MKLFSLEDSACESGQYLVEFSLSIVVFMIFVFFVVDMGLLIYNHNVFYHGVYVGARKASLGADNETIRSTVVNEVVPNYFPSLFMRAHPDTGVTIDPEKEIHRVEGESVTVEMDTTFGLTLMGLYTMTLDVPISSQILIIANNDEDRDGCKDVLESSNTSCSGWQNFNSTYPQDHDNDSFSDQYIFDGVDQDADNDGILIEDEWVEVGYFETTPVGDSVYAIARPGTGAIAPTFSPAGNHLWEVWYDGSYNAPVLWADGSQSPPQYFERTVPRWHVNNSGDTTYQRRLFTSYDADNDGWEDKYDDFPRDPEQH